MPALKLVRHNGVAVVTLDYPPVNALDSVLLRELAELFAKLARDRSIGAAVITSEKRSFSAGLNLKVARDLGLEGQRRLIAALNDCFGILYGWPKPLIAAVNGHAIGGGLVLALCADRRFVADTAMQVALAEVRVGAPYPVAALDVSRAELTPTAARRLVLLGETFDAADAVTLSVFDECVPADELMARAIAAANKFAALPAKTFATIKSELRAPVLARIAAARAGQAEPRFAEWLGDELRQAAEQVLRTAN